MRFIDRQKNSATRLLTLGKQGNIRLAAAGTAARFLPQADVPSAAKRAKNRHEK